MFGISRYFHPRMSIKWENNQLNPSAHMQVKGIAVAVKLKTLSRGYHLLACLSTEVNRKAYDIFPAIVSSFTLRINPNIGSTSFGV
jgi:hypothetical protein